MNFAISKPSVPAIWVDTFAVINMAKARRGRKFARSNQYTHLFRTIESKAREKKLICPMGGQLEEIEEGGAMIAECLDTLWMLCKGIQFLHKDHIMRTQEDWAMAAYIRRLGAITQPYEAAFKRDPIQILARRFSPPPKPKLTPKSHTNLRKQLKNNQFFFLSDRRESQKAAHRTYEEALEQAYLAPIQLLNLVREYIVESKPVPKYVLPLGVEVQSEIMQQRLGLWIALGGEPKDWEGLVGFWMSEAYRSIPSVEIGAKLFALLDVHNDAVKSSDANDYGFMATVLPYCQFILIDNATKSRIEQLGLDAKFGSRLFRERDLDDLINSLKAL